MKSKKKKGIIVAVISIVVIIITVAGIVLSKYIKFGWDFRERTPKKYRDFQGYWICQDTLMKTEKGYYIMDMSDLNSYKRLCYWDGKSDSYEVVCKKANCNHDNDKCSACFFENICESHYSNGYIFYTEKDEERNIYLCRSNVDGTKRKRLLKIADGNLETIDARAYVHNNNVFVYAFYYNDNGETCKLIHYDMEKWQNDGFKKEISSIQDFRYMYVEDIRDNKFLYMVRYDDYTELYEYDMKTLENCLVRKVEGWINYARYVEEDIAYATTAGAFFIKSGNEEAVKFSDVDGQLTTDGKYIYIDNVPKFRPNNEPEHKVYIYDLKGKLVHTIAMPEESKEAMMVCFVDNDNKVIATILGKTELYVKDKDNLDAEWRLITKED